MVAAVVVDVVAVDQQQLIHQPIHEFRQCSHITQKARRSCICVDCARHATGQLLIEFVNIWSSAGMDDRESDSAAL